MDTPHLGYCVVFLFVAVVLAMLQLETKTAETGDTGNLQKFRLFLALAGLLIACYSFQGVLSKRLNLLHRGWNTNEIAFDYLRSGSRSTYFPGYPLAHLLAENNLYHFSFAAYERSERVGHPVSREQFAKHIPPGMDAVCMGGVFERFSTWFLQEELEKFPYPMRLGNSDLFNCFTKSPSPSTEPQVSPRGSPAAGGGGFMASKSGSENARIDADSQ